VYVLLNDIRFGLGIVGFVSIVIAPLSDLIQFVEQEDAFALGLANWLHDLHNVFLLVLFKFFHKQTVVCRQVVGHGPKLHLGGLVEFARALEVLFVALEVLDHVVFPSEFLVVSEVIYFLVGKQVGGVKYFVGPVAVHPTQVPIVIFCFFPTSRL